MKTLLSLILLSLSVFATADIVVVVPKSSETQKLNSSEVANIFLSRTNRFPNGDRSYPIELKGHGIRSHFYESISGKTPNQLSAYWTTLVFTGKGRPPKSYQDVNKLIDHMRNDPRAIAYLNKEQVTETMKIVYTFD